MKTPVLVGAGVFAVATVIVTATASGGSKVPLPLPHTAMPSHRAPSAGSSGRGSTVGTLPEDASPTGNASPPQANQPVTYTTSLPFTLSGCSVSVTNPAPLRGQTAETATVTTTPGAEIRLEADYVGTRSVHSRVADGSGNAQFSLAISHADAGVTVPVTATVSLRGAKYSCSTSFTPVDPPGSPPTTR